MGEERRCAMVTGGAGGIGLGVARRFVESGVDVAVIDSQAEALDLAVGRLHVEDEHAGRVHAHQADVTQPDQVDAAVADCRREFGRIDILVNVAGGAGPTQVRDIDAMELETWQHVIDLNLTSTFLFCRAVVPVMRERGYGRIVNFSSIIANGENGPPTTVAGRLPYATAKSALIGFTSQLAKDVAGEGITVNVLLPALILGEPGTRIRDRFDALTPEIQTQMMSRYPMQRAGSAQDVATAVAFFCSDDAGYVSGASLVIDGAYT